jgi:hypothetical protein
MVEHTLTEGAKGRTSNGELARLEHLFEGRREHGLGFLSRRVGTQGLALAIGAYNAHKKATIAMLRDASGSWLSSPVHGLPRHNSRSS